MYICTRIYIITDEKRHRFLEDGEDDQVDRDRSRV